jgi:hypothetical protein
VTLENKTYTFNVADHIVRIVDNNTNASGSKPSVAALIPSFKNFYVDDNECNALFTLTVDDSIRPVPKDQRQRIRAFDTGNGETIVDEITTGGYQYIIKNTDGRDCCLLICNGDFSVCRCALNGNTGMRVFGLNNAIMLVFAFATSHLDTVMLHASLVRHDKRGYAFIAKSGTGKSTQVSMWLRHIPDCDLMNDDNPIVRVVDDKVFIYGSPWSGKTPCYRNTKAPLGAITRIDRAKTNSIEKLAPVDAFASLLPACSAMKWDVGIMRSVCDTVTKIIERIPIYTLHCLPDKQSAIVCHNAIANNKS